MIHRLYGYACRSIVRIWNFSNFDTGQNFLKRTNNCNFSTFQKQTNKNLKSCCLQYIKEIKYLGINQLKEVYELNKKFGKIVK